MEDDEEIQSHPASPVSGSPPHPNGRITVTVAAAAAAQSSSNNVLTLALPIQQVLPAAGRSGGGREDCWSEEATAVLIEAWGERYMELSRGNLKQKHWKEVADIVCSRCEDYGKTPKTDIQCKNRIDTVKKKYKLERAKISAGSGPSKWRFFDRLDHLIGPSATKTPNPKPKPVPMGIPVGIRSYGYHPPQPHGLMLHNPNPTFKHKMQFRRRDPSDSDSDNNSTDSFPPEPPYLSKKPRIQVNLKSNPKPSSAGGAKGEEKKNWGNSVKELTQAILKFGEVYEQAESSKLQQMVEMEKQRMKFAKEVELQRMHFFMKTQMEISQLRHGRRVGNNSNHHSNINNNSDSSN